MGLDKYIYFLENRHFFSQRSPPLSWGIYKPSGDDEDNPPLPIIIIQAEFKSEELK